jgi:pimeloyl-ACP methyl ester carboxylesterase
MARLILVHSPFVGPYTWRAVAERLRAHGHQVVLPDLTGIWSGCPPWLPPLVSAVAHADSTIGDRGTEPSVLVGHSGAGPLLPAVADGLTVRPRRLVLVDSAMPYPGRSWREAAPAELVAHLEGLGARSELPRWDAWFEPGAVEELVPEEATRAAFTSELPRVPLSYLDEPTPPHQWTGPGSYLLLSEGYRASAAEANRRGWRVEHVTRHHLAPVTCPDEVADALLRLST